MASDDKNKLISILEDVWKSPSIIIKTQDYIYAIRKENDKWEEISYLIADKDLQKRNLSSEEALLYLIEELTKSLIQYSPPLKESIIIDKEKLDEILKLI